MESEDVEMRNMEKGDYIPVCEDISDASQSEGEMGENAENLEIVPLSFAQTAATVTKEATSLQKPLSEVAGSKIRILNLIKEELEEVQAKITIKDGTAIIEDDAEKKKEEERRTIIYRTLNKSKQVEWFSEKKIELTLKPILEKVEKKGEGTPLLTSTD